jgi:fused signal recognition particle receptor
MLGLAKGLKKTKERLLTPLRAIFSSRKLDAETVEEIEELLLAADLGLEATERIVERLRERIKAGEGGKDEAIGLIAGEILGLIDEIPAGDPPDGAPRVIVVVGVNGVGKTSTIGKIAHRFTSEGKTVLLAACDTFRAAAIEQLELWAGRARVPIVRQKMGSDPAAVAFDAVQSARAKGIDIVLIDTAGRLHTKTSLMEELKKIFRVLGSRIAGIGVESWLVLDANTGQNSIQQAEAFVRSLPVTGLVLTKLDSTAKGGAVIPIQKMLRVPVLFVGVGEGIGDLEPFDHELFVSELIGEHGADCS